MQQGSILVNEDIIQNLKSEQPGEKVVEALLELLDKDGYLLECNVNERSISHRLGMYIQSQFQELDVDCEYNRDGVEPKRIGYIDIHPDQEDTEAKTVFPDIIVHKRNTKQNYLVIEVKKSTSTVDRNIDRQKLEGYKRELGYEYALFIEFLVQDKSGVAMAEWVNA